MLLVLLNFPYSNSLEKVSGGASSQGVADIPWYLLPSMLHALPEKKPGLKLDIVLPNENQIAEYLATDPCWADRIAATSKHPFHKIPVSEWHHYLRDGLGYALGSIEVVPANCAAALKVLPSFGFSPCPFLRRAFEERLIQFGGKEESLEALDVGCGAGRDLVFLARSTPYRWHLTGVDSVTSVLKSARLLDSFYSSSYRDYPEFELVNGVFRKDGQFRYLEHTHLPRWGSELGELRQRSFHLILSVRFLVRESWDLLDSLLLPGGFFFSHTFSKDSRNQFPFERPKGPNHLLENDELLQRFAPKTGYRVIFNGMTELADGRYVNNFLCQKL